MNYDFLVVGSGPGGSIFAAEAAARGASVLIVEEGPWAEPGSVEPYSRAQMRRLYRNQGLTAAIGRPPIAYTEARCVGGGSEVNAGLYHAPGEALLARWGRDYGLLGLERERLAPHLAAIEQRLAIAVDEVGSEPLAQGAEALGWEGRHVPRWVHDDGQGREQRRSMSTSYLADAVAAGAEVRPETRVDRLLVDRSVGSRGRLGLRGGRVRGGRVRGVLSGPTTIRADHVVLAAGAIGTPALIQRSGLRIPHAGSGLSVHPTVKAVGVFDPPPSDDGRLTHGPTISAYQVKQWGDRLSLGSSASRPGLIAMALADNDPLLARRAMAESSRMRVYYAAIRSHGRGWVRAVPGAADPLVGYHLTDADLGALTSGLGRLALALLAGGAREVICSLPGTPVIRTPREIPAALAAVTRRAPLMTVHLTGTMASGEDVGRCATDSWGRVREVDGLSVSDASLLPDAPGINPQGTLMALARRNAEVLLDDDSTADVASEVR
ncbi:MAG: GMC family oxidoreductase N-terminal domain-containing protein [Nocardioides sp.]